MRLLLLNHEFPPAGGGAANASLEIARALVELGHEPVVVTSRHPAKSAKSKDQRFPVHFVAPTRRKLESGTIPEMLRYIPSAFFAARRLHAKQPFDACIAFFSIPGGVAARALKTLCGIPYIVLLRGGDVPGLVPEIQLLHSIIAPIRNAVYASAALVAANSKGLQTLAQQSSKDMPVSLIPNGVDCSQFYPVPNVPSESPAFRILFVGRLNPQKRIHLLLEAACVCKSPIRLTIVGDGPEKSKLMRISASKGINVSWCGWLAKERLRHVYASHDCFVNPSAYEGMPNTLLEAMACGLPPIASNVSGNTDLIQNGVTGLLFDHGSSDQLASAIDRLASDTHLCARIGINARQHVKKFHDWKISSLQCIAPFLTEADFPNTKNDQDASTR